MLYPWTNTNQSQLNRKRVSHLIDNNLLKMLSLAVDNSEPINDAFMVKQQPAEQTESQKGY